MINYLTHSEIDKTKWDQCIDNSVNRLVYAKSWYLDIVSPRWEALIASDFQMVMPLPVKHKLFLAYLVQPLFTQQLGVFSAKEITSDDVSDFLNHIPQKFFRQIFNLNSANMLPQMAGVTDRMNFELDLNQKYSFIYQGYNENTQRNCKKGISKGILVEPSNDISLFIRLYEKYAKKKPNRFTLEKLRKVITYAIDNQKGEIVFACENANTAISGAFFLKDLGRIIYMTSFSTAKGLENSAMFLIMDEMIRKNAMKPIIFDFEGSMIPGVARFFAGFGAEKKVYQQYRKSFRL